MSEPAVRVIIQTPDFFFLPLRQMEIERSEVTARTYFIHRGRIVAVAVKPEDTR